MTDPRIRDTTIKKATLTPDASVTPVTAFKIGNKKTCLKTCPETNNIIQLFNLFFRISYQTVTHRLTDRGDIYIYICRKDYDASYDNDT